MTDTRLPEHWLTSPVLDALSDPAHRVYVNGLVWSVTHGTDGVLPVRSLRWLHPDATAVGPAAAELVACGLWRAEGGGYAVPDFLKWQTAAEDVEAGRTKGRDNRRRQRKHNRGDHTECRPDTCSVVRLSQGDSDPGRTATPEDRTGQDSARGDQIEDYAARAREGGNGQSALGRALAAGGAEPKQTPR